MPDPAVTQASPVPTYSLGLRMRSGTWRLSEMPGWAGSPLVPGDQKLFISQGWLDKLFSLGEPSSSVNNEAEALSGKSLTEISNFLLQELFEDRDWILLPLEFPVQGLTQHKGIASRGACLTYHSQSLWVSTLTAHQKLLGNMQTSFILKVVKSVWSVLFTCAFLFYSILNVILTSQAGWWFLFWAGEGLHVLIAFYCVNDSKVSIPSK